MRRLLFLTAPLFSLALLQVMPSVVRAQASPRDLSKYLVDEHTRLIGKDSQLRQVKAAMEREKAELEGKLRQIVAARKNSDQKAKQGRQGARPQPDYSRYNLCPNGKSWYQCDHDDLKRLWLEGELARTETQFQRNMEAILREFQQRSDDINASLADPYRTSLKDYEQKIAKMQGDIDKLKQDIDTLRSAVVAQMTRTSIGALSSKEESGGDPGRVSPGTGDPGGISYGLYQMSSTKGTVADFVSKNYTAEFQGLAPGTPEFKAKWQQLAKDQPLQFAQKQHDYIKATHYDVTAQKVKQDSGFDVNSRSKTLQDVVWSTAVQNGEGKKEISASRVVEKALQSFGNVNRNTLTDEQIIKAIYAERGRKNDAGNLVYFSGSPQDQQINLSNRFTREQQAALETLRQEQTIRPPR